ncbi:hypothetical protein MMC26_000602 [Xylographa opegraphella]|nr:hypothetical protein [Xylographa opegraphella]
MKFTVGLLAGIAASVAAQNTATSTAAVAAAKATAKTESPVSHVAGKAFDRIAIIYLENTDYDMATSNRKNSLYHIGQEFGELMEPAANLTALAKQGILLANYFATTHPSEPNYVAAIGGDHFGMDNDNFNFIPSNVSTVIDLLEDKGIAWGEYQEDMPYSGFEGYSWINQKTRANDYVRKHNPAVIYDANSDNPDRLAKMKNFTQFAEDLANNELPQWMFITPNMTNDGHDTSVAVAGVWAENFLTPLLTNPNFMDNTLVLLTFDETETYTEQNRIMGILLGDSIPKNLIGTTDLHFYDHYSQIATVEANWGLHTLGRWDVGANVFAHVAAKTGDTMRKWISPSFNTVFLNSSYPGPFNSKNSRVPLPAPDVAATMNGRTVLPSIVSTWSQDQAACYYTTDVEIPDGQHPPKYGVCGTA